MSDWKEIKNNEFFLKQFYPFNSYINYKIVNDINDVYNCNKDTWDFQWYLRCIIEKSFCITPCVNLIKNIGFEGTRSSNSSPFLCMSNDLCININNLIHPTFSFRHEKIDEIIFHNIYIKYSKFKLLKIFLFKTQIIHIYDFIKNKLKLLKIRND